MGPETHEQSLNLEEPRDAKKTPAGKKPELSIAVHACNPTAGAVEKGGWIRSS